MAKKPSSLDPVHPNAGLEAAYKRKLDALIEEMHRSLLWWISAAYKANEPEMAMDVSPAVAMQMVMRRLGKYWLKRFNKAAPELARYFAKNSADRVESSLKSILKKAGISVEFKMTASVNDVMQATVGAQVSLIKSIAQQHLTDVEGMVMRSVQTGRDLGTLTKEIQEKYVVTKKRAALIARDQNNKATATITRVRQGELGITKAIWMHSHGGKEPRPSHLKASNDKLVYDIEKGAYLDGVWTWPGVEINCRCVSRPIIPGLER